MTEPTKKLPDNITTEQRRGLLAELAKGLDNAWGFAAFYELVFNRELPHHAWKWAKQVYKDKKAGQGSVIQAFRGSTKTTTVTIAFTAFRIGHEPQASNLLIQVGDDIADDNASAIADIIENNPGWKLAFEHVVPDRDKGWGAGGYEVKRTDIAYEEWREINAARKDPTLLGVGYKSREIIGKHPSGVLVVDDIHDENNTSSARELANVLKILQGTIFPTMTDETWSIFIGTPWTKNDTLAYVEATKRFGVGRTPVYIVADEDTPGAIELNNEWIVLTWPERFTVE